MEHGSFAFRRLMKQASGADGNHANTRIISWCNVHANIC